MNLYKSNHHRHKHSSYGIKSIDFYACQSSLKFWNSSYKVLSACFILILCILLDCVWVSIAVIVTTGLVNLLVNKVSAGDYIDFLKIPIAFLMLGCIVLFLAYQKIQLEIIIFFCLEDICILLKRVLDRHWHYFLKLWELLVLCIYWHYLHQ